MKDNLHQAISAELEQTTRTDKTTIIVAILINFLLISVNSGTASAVWFMKRSYDAATKTSTSTPMFSLNMLLIFLIFIGATIAFNIFVIRALSRGIERRIKLTEGLAKMYQEEGLDKYYDTSLIQGYKSRYGLYKSVIIILWALAILVPLVTLRTY